MTDILDKICSNFYIGIVLVIIIFISFIVLSFKNPFKNKAANTFYKIIMYICAAGPFIALQFTYYGYSKEFKKICVGKTTICLFERYRRGRNGKVCRLHIVDRATGLRKDRIYVGTYGELIGMRNDTVCYLSGNDVVLFNTADLKEIYTLDIDNWGTILPELSVGIKDVSGIQKHAEAIKNPFVTLSCKNGKKYWFDPFSKQILAKQPGNIYSPEFSKSGDNLTVRYNDNKKINYLNLETISGSSLQRIVPGYDMKKMFSASDSTGYIDPSFLGIDTLKKVFVFSYYETTDRTNYFVEAKDFDFKTKWKKANREFGDDVYNTPQVNVWKYTNDTLYFNNGGFLVAVDPVTSKIYWTTRL